MAGNRKLGRTRDPRRALMKGLASDLIDRQSITTTRAKAKELIPYVERLITKAKRGDLHNRRQIIARVATPASAHKLVDHLAQKLDGRSSGHLRLRPAGWRQGDHSPLATVSFVGLDPVTVESSTATPNPANAKAKAEAAKKPGPSRRPASTAGQSQPTQPKPDAGRQTAGRNRANQKRV